MSEPGGGLYRFARHVCGDATMRRLIDPWLADLRHEYNEAIARGRRGRAAVVRIAYLVSFLELMASGVVRAPGVASMLVWQTASIIVVTGIFLLPFVRTLGSQAPNDRWPVLVAYLTPSALMIGLVLGAVVGLVFSLRRRRPSAELRAAAMAVAVACAASEAILDTWVLPPSNQAFRETIAGRPLPRGFNERTPAE